MSQLLIRRLYVACILACVFAEGSTVFTKTAPLPSGVILVAATGDVRSVDITTYTPESSRGGGPWIGLARGRPSGKATPQADYHGSKAVASCASSST